MIITASLDDDKDKDLLDLLSKQSNKSAFVREALRFYKDFRNRMYIGAQPVIPSQERITVPQRDRNEKTEISSQNVMSCLKSFKKK